MLETTPEWLALTVQQRVDAFTAQVLPAIDLLVGTENGYARTYGLEPVATFT